MCLTAVLIGVLLCFQNLPSASEETCNCSVSVSEKDVLEYIFKNYTKGARPKVNVSEPVEVTLSFRISAVHDLIERENTLILDGYLYSLWHDDFLGWNWTDPFCCIKLLVVPPGSTWLPDISLVNSPKGMYALMLSPGYTIAVHSDGSIVFTPGGQIYSKCEVDVTYFPFDQQTCQVNFESWNYDTAEQVFRLHQTMPFVKIENSWTENRQWLIEANSSSIENVTYFDNTEYTHVSFTLILRRKALFYYVNIIAPSIIISVVELATFALPIDEVIKIHISFTCLLAYSVFQGMVIADLPRSGDSVPLLSLYIDLQMGYIGIIALLGEALVFLIIRRARLKKAYPPRSVLSAFVTLARFLCVQCHFEIKDETGGESLNDLLPDYYYHTEGYFSAFRAGHATHREAMPLDHDAKRSGDPLQRKEEIAQQWMFIAEVIERIHMILYIAAISITPIVMFDILPNTKIESIG